MVYLPPPHLTHHLVPVPGVVLLVLLRLVVHLVVQNQQEVQTQMICTEILPDTEQLLLLVAKNTEQHLIHHLHRNIDQVIILRTKT